MKSVHIVCRRDGLHLAGVEYDKENKVYRSGCWDFSAEEANDLVGGLLYLHETKSKPSTFGGRIVGYEQVRLGEFDSASRKDRIQFIFEPAMECKNAKWQGKTHQRQWTSGILEH